MRRVYFSPINKKVSELRIEKGMKTWAILKEAYKKEILPHPVFALISTVLFDGRPRIEAGDYQFVEKQSLHDIFASLKKGEVIVRKIFFFEGETVHALLEEIKQDQRFSGDITITVSEGSLFPSTYHIKRNEDRNQFILKMQKEMDKVANAVFKENENPHIKNIQDLIVWASILEKEAITPQEMPRISGVFKNRFSKGMRLQSCPTVIYAKTHGKPHNIQQVTYKDLEIDSLYNTYKYDGLPKGPISCPGLNALKAAAHPLKSSEFYFVCDGKQHFFSKTYKEHLAYIRRIRSTGIK